MAIRTVVTRGYGNGTFNGTIADVSRRGYASGAAAQAEEEVFSGGYEHHPYAYKPKRFELKRKEKKAEKVIVDLVTKSLDVKPEKKDLEIGLRLRLAQIDLEYKKKYLEIAYQEALREYLRREKLREEEEITLILMML